MNVPLADDEIQILDEMRRLSPENRIRISRLINSWIQRDKEKRSANNVIPFVKKMTLLKDEN